LRLHSLKISLKKPKRKLAIKNLYLKMKSKNLNKEPKKRPKRRSKKCSMVTIKIKKETENVMATKVIMIEIETIKNVTTMTIGQAKIVLDKEL
jgi:hypothetical protein